MSCPYSKKAAEGSLSDLAELEAMSKCPVMGDLFFPAPTGPVPTLTSQEKAIPPAFVRTNYDDKEWINTLRSSSIAWCESNGLKMIKKSADTANTSSIPSEADHSHLYVHAPISLHPFPLSRKLYQHLLTLAPLFNTLVDKIAREEEWLLNTLKDTAEGDPDFVGKLVQVWQTLRQEASSVERGGLKQKWKLGIHRSDYMLQSSHPLDTDKVNSSQLGQEAYLSHVHTTALQVELNTIAASFAGLSTKVSGLHKFLAGWVNGVGEGQTKVYLPDNRAVQNIANAIAKASQVYKEENPDIASRDSIVIFVVQAGESNAVDQKILADELSQEHGIRVVRKTLLEIEEQGSLDERKHLVIENQIVTVVYFRAGYTPNDFPTQSQWDALLKIERSHSIKCPSVQYHLAGCKKVQQQLAVPGEVEKFLSAEDAGLLRTCFAGLWGLEHDDETTQQIIQEAITHADQYVLKPQREGGGNNLWGDELIQALKQMPRKERAAYILMKKITPAPFYSLLMRNANVELSASVCELGIYSAYLSSSLESVVINEACGHLLRTKHIQTKEGGVAAGYACLDSPLLLAEEEIEERFKGKPQL